MITEDSNLLGKVSPALEEHYNLISFPSIAAGLAHLRAHRETDLLILDMEHNGTSSKEFLLDLRSAFDWSGLPAVIILPEKDDSIDEFLEAHGANYVIHKPASPEQVQAQISAVFQH